MALRLEQWLRFPSGSIKGYELVSHYWNRGSDWSGKPSIRHRLHVWQRRDVRCSCWENPYRGWIAKLPRLGCHGQRPCHHDRHPTRHSHCPNYRLDGLPPRLRQLCHPARWNRPYCWWSRVRSTILRRHIPIHPRNIQSDHPQIHKSRSYIHSAQLPLRRYPSHGRNSRQRWRRTLRHLRYQSL